MHVYRPIFRYCYVLSLFTFCWIFILLIMRILSFLVMSESDFYYLNSSALQFGLYNPYVTFIFLIKFCIRFPTFWSSSSLKRNRLLSQMTCLHCTKLLLLCFLHSFSLALFSLNQFGMISEVSYLQITTKQDSSSDQKGTETEAKQHIRTVQVLGYFEQPGVSP